MKSASTLLFALILSATAAHADEPLLDTSFTTRSEFSHWLPVDANYDGTSWKYDEEATPSHVYYSYSSVNDANDWLLSPRFTITEPAKYRVSYILYGSAAGESAEICWGDARSSRAMTNKGAVITEIKDSPVSGQFTCDVKPGDFIVGIHATSPADRWRLHIINIKIENADSGASIPAIYTDSNATPHVLVSPGMISVPTATQITLYTVTGTMVAQTRADSLPCPLIEADIYIVRAETPSGTVNAKISLKGGHTSH